MVFCLVGWLVGTHYKTREFTRTTEDEKKKNEKRREERRSGKFWNVNIIIISWMNGFGSVRGWFWAVVHTVWQARQAGRDY